MNRKPRNHVIERRQFVSCLKAASRRLRNSAPADKNTRWGYLYALPRDRDQLAKIRQHRWKESLQIS